MSQNEHPNQDAATPGISDAPAPQGQPFNPTPAPQGQPFGLAPQGMPFNPAANSAVAQEIPLNEPQRVHHSYIWLSSLSTFVVILVALSVSLASTFAGLASEGVLGAEGAFGAGLAVAAVAVGFALIGGLIVLIQWLSYKHLWYVLGPEDFSLHSGIISKKRVHVPYRRIQSVDQKATLVQRIFGVCSVTIDTAGGADNKAVLVPYLTKERAALLRRELFMLKANALSGGASAQPQQPAAAPGTAATAANPTAGDGSASAEGGAGNEPHNVLDNLAAVWDEAPTVFSGVPDELTPPSYQYGLTNKELVFAGLTGNTAFAMVILVVIGFLSQAVEAFSFLLPGAEGAFEDLVYTAVVEQLAGNAVLAIVGFVIVAALVLWGISIVGSCISYGGFKASRRGTRIEVEHGLLQHVIQGVNIDRVQTVVIKQSFIRRLMGYCELSLGRIDAQTEGEESSGASLAGQGLVIHPFVKLDQVPGILNGLVPEFSDLPVDQQPVARVAKRRAIIRRVLVQGGGFWLAVCALLLCSFMHWGFDSGAMVESIDDLDFWMVAAPFIDLGTLLALAIAVLLAVIELVSALKWAKESSYAVNRRFMTVRNGGLSTTTVSFPRAKIQYGFTRANPLQRRAGTCTLMARTAAGVGGTTYSLIDVTRDDGDAWLAWLEPGNSALPGHAGSKDASHQPLQQEPATQS